METIAKQKQATITTIEKYVSFSDAQKMVKEQNGKMVEFKDLISAIKNPEQLKKLRGYRYWISNEGKDFQKAGYHKIDFEKERIVSISEKEYDKLPFEQRAYVYTGSGPVAVDVDYGSSRRLGVYADDVPGYDARVALIKPSQVAQQEKGTAIAQETLEEMKASLKVLRTTVNPELLKPFEEAIRSSEQ